MLVDLACDFAIAGSALYELGHTIVELLPTLHARLTSRVELISMDESEERLRNARRALNTSARPIHFMRADLDRGIVVRNASVAIMAGTSQQVHPLHRPQLLADVYRGLRDGGCALVMEVTRSRDSLLNNFFATHTRGPGPSDICETGRMMQMAGTVDEECALLSRSAFRSVEIFYKRYGLCGLIAIK